MSLKITTSTASIMSDTVFGKPGILDRSPELKNAVSKFVSDYTKTKEMMANFALEDAAKSEKLQKLSRAIKNQKKILTAKERASRAKGAAVRDLNEDVKAKLLQRLEDSKTRYAALEKAIDDLLHEQKDNITNLEKAYDNLDNILAKHLPAESRPTKEAVVEDVETILRENAVEAEVASKPTRVIKVKPLTQEETKTINQDVREKFEEQATKDSIDDETREMALLTLFKMQVMRPDQYHALKNLSTPELQVLVVLGAMAVVTAKQKIHATNEKIADLRNEAQFLTNEINGIQDKLLSSDDNSLSYAATTPKPSMQSSRKDDNEAEIEQNISRSFSGRN